MKASCRRVSVLAISLCALMCLPARSGSGVTAPTAGPGAVQASSTAAGAPASVATTPIPGPLRSFLRMAGISQKVSPDEVLPLLSREVAVKGYQTVTVKSGKAPSAGRSTEYLLLLQGYLKQARELQVLAGPEGVIRVSNCSDAQPLLAILGYRLAQACGPNVALQTADADKAFLAVDSGFPLANLEESLRSGQPFNYPYAPSRVPVLFSESDLDCSRRTSRRTITSMSSIRFCLIQRGRGFTGACRGSTRKPRQAWPAISWPQKTPSSHRRRRLLRDPHFHPRRTGRCARRRSRGGRMEKLGRGEPRFAQRNS